MLTRIPVSSLPLKHPACGFALESLPQAGPVSSAAPGGAYR